MWERIKYIHFFFIRYYSGIIQSHSPSILVWLASSLIVSDCFNLSILLNAINHTLSVS